MLVLVVIVANLRLWYVCSGPVEKEDAASVEGVVPPQNESVEKGAKVAEGVSAQELLVELAATAECQTELVTQLKTQYVGESSTLAQKDGEISLLRAQLAGAQEEAESAKAHADKLAKDKVSMLADLQHAKGELHQIQANMTWSVRYLDERRVEHFTNIEEFKVRMKKIIQVQEEKLRGLSIEYDEELYPHLMSTIAERRYVCILLPYCLIIFVCLSFLIHVYLFYVGG